MPQFLALLQFSIFYGLIDETEPSLICSFVAFYETIVTAEYLSATCSLFKTRTYLFSRMVQFTPITQPVNIFLFKKYAKTHSTYHMTTYSLKHVISALKKALSCIQTTFPYSSYFIPRIL